MRGTQQIPPAVSAVAGHRFVLTVVEATGSDRSQTRLLTEKSDRRQCEHLVRELSKNFPQRAQNSPASAQP